MNDRHRRGMAAPSIQQTTPLSRSTPALPPLPVMGNNVLVGADPDDEGRKALDQQQGYSNCAAPYFPAVGRHDEARELERRKKHVAPARSRENWLSAALIIASGAAAISSSASTTSYGVPQSPHLPPYPNHHLDPVTPGPHSSCPQCGTPYQRGSRGFQESYGPRDHVIGYERTQGGPHRCPACYCPTTTRPSATGAPTRFLASGRREYIAGHTSQSQSQQYRGGASATYTTTDHGNPHGVAMTSTSYSGTQAHASASAGYHPQAALSFSTGVSSRLASANDQGVTYTMPLAANSLISSNSVTRSASIGAGVAQDYASAWAGYQPAFSSSTGVSSRLAPSNDQGGIYTMPLAADSPISSNSVTRSASIGAGVAQDYASASAGYHPALSFSTGVRLSSRPAPANDQGVFRTMPLVADPLFSSNSVTRSASISAGVNSKPAPASEQGVVRTTPPATRSLLPSSSATRSASISAGVDSRRTPANEQSVARTTPPVAIAPLSSNSITRSASISVGVNSKSAAASARGVVRTTPPVASSPLSSNSVTKSASISAGVNSTPAPASEQGVVRTTMSLVASVPSSSNDVPSQEGRANKVAAYSGPTNKALVSDMTIRRFIKSDAVSHAREPQPLQPHSNFVPSFWHHARPDIFNT